MTANEKRLIDANDAVKAVTDIYCCTAGYRARERLWQAVEAVKEIPTVDAVEVVRCKNCQSFEQKWSWDNLNTGKVECCGYCYHWDYEPGMSPNQVDGDDFCSYGERKDNG